MLIEMDRAADAVMAPMSFGQERLWFVDGIVRDAALYNVRKALRLQGAVDVAALQESIDALVRRHEILRTSFSLVDDRPMQIVEPALHVPLTSIDLSALSASERETQLECVVREEGAQCFTLGAVPLLRATLVRLAPHDHVLVLTLHHIITDEWSGDIFNRELSIAYAAYCAGREPAFDELPIQYADYAVWQRQWLQGDVLERQLGFWRQRLAGAPPRTELPVDRARTATLHASQAGSESLVLPRALSDALQELGRRHGVTPFMLMLAAFRVLLFRYTGQSDLVVGSPIANRPRRELQGLIGFFVNTLLLRANVRAEDRFSDVLRNERETVLAAFERQDLPFEKLVAELAPDRSTGGTPLVNVLFVMRHKGEPVRELGNLQLGPVKLGGVKAKFDLTLNVASSPGELSCTLVYDAELFDAVRVQRMLAHFQTLLQSIVAAPERPVTELALLSASERETILVGWNDTATDYGSRGTIHGAFAAQVRRTPEAVAVAHDDARLSYRELGERADGLARDLRAHGVRRGDFVAICVERSIDMVVAALAVLKAGGAYVPLDCEYPQDRLAYMLADCGARVVLTQRRLTARLRAPGTLAAFIEVDAPRSAHAEVATLEGGGSADDVAYVIYTSGSTGRPKGVLVPHRAVKRLVTNTNYIRIESGDVFGQVSSFSFDAITFELWGALLHGARLEIIARNVTLSPQLFARALHDKRVSVMFLTAALFRQVASEIPSAFKGLRYLLAGGEALDPATVAAVLEHGPPEHLLNGYGPTEATTFACTYEITGPRALGIPIGRPIANTEAYVLDDARKPVPVGVAGQLYLGGPGLAHGYLNDPEQTARKFVAHPFRGPGAGLYATGDTVRYLADGNIEFIGRRDNQVKIRGFRVETGEIETALRDLPEMRDALVVVREDAAGDKRLVAYVVDGARPGRSSDRLRALLAQTLPAYMLPSQFVPVPAMPLTPNGKLDVAALPAPAAGAAVVSGLEARLSNPLHYQLVEMWEKLLDVRPVGVRDDFFALGGHSLLAMRLMSEVERAFGKSISLAGLIADFTIENLARELVDGVGSAAAQPLVTLHSKGSAAPFFYMHGDFSGGGYYTRKLARHLSPDQPFYILPPHGTNGRPMPPTIEAMAADYIAIIKEAVPQGPYVLGGFCSGGLVAFEVARQLEASNEVVNDVILIDCFGTNGRLASVAGIIDLVASIFRIDEQARLGLTGIVARLARRVRRYRPRRVITRIKRLTALPSMVLRERIRLRLRRLSRSVVHPGMDPGLQRTWQRTGAKYIPRRYHGRITLLVPRPAKVAQSSVLGWRAVAKSVEIHAIRGNHLTCITQYVDDTASLLNDCLAAEHIL